MGPYLWVKAFHVIGFVIWMAGLSYLPRLFAYHGRVAPGSEASEMFKAMEARLFWIVTTPGLILTYAFGVWLLVLSPGLLSDGWMHLKLTAVLFLTIFHLYMGVLKKRFASDGARPANGFLRGIGEIPSVLLVISVLVAVVKPF